MYIPFVRSFDHSFVTQTAKYVVAFVPIENLNMNMKKKSMSINMNMVMNMNMIMNMNMNISIFAC
jgi:hypothetical protein